MTQLNFQKAGSKLTTPPAVQDQKHPVSPVHSASSNSGSSGDAPDFKERMSASSTLSADDGCPDALWLNVKTSNTPFGQCGDLDWQLSTIEMQSGPTTQSTTGSRRGIVSCVGTEPKIFIPNLGECRFAYRSMKRGQHEQRPVVHVGDEVLCRLTQSDPPRAVCVRLVRGPKQLDLDRTKTAQLSEEDLQVLRDDERILDTLWVAQ
eukprot:TRINITY_DN285_c0_g1_i9.p1 TRINITY_DN285_c0_g1~~TRINITY_DN285_c0_g1_i9.p1  ORF type:complete len:206 (+),score=25.92 TRINITY_DN285_c0_g1_i9:88-705(+)